MLWGEVVSYSFIGDETKGQLVYSGVPRAYRCWSRFSPRSYWPKPLGNISFRGGCKVAHSHCAEYLIWLEQFTSRKGWMRKNIFLYMRQRRVNHRWITTILVIFIFISYLWRFLENSYMKIPKFCSELEIYFLLLLSKHHSQGQTQYTHS